jgi:FkbM family methyltransferase
LPANPIDCAHRMPTNDRILRYLDLLLEPGAIRAIATWPIFSISSFKMISALARQGIVPRTVIDVGANAGQFAVASAMIFPNVEVYSFEPVPETVSALKENVRNLPNVKVYPFALGERPGHSTFHVNSHSQSSSILALGRPHLEAFPDEREVRTIEVELTTLDAVFHMIHLKPPVLLKLDVQGYEAKTLAGAQQTLKRCDYVVAEASFKPMYEGETPFSEILAMMERKNFAFLRPVGWLTEPRTGEILQLDALFQMIASERRASTADTEAAVVK